MPSDLRFPQDTPRRAGIELWKMTGFESWQTWFAVLGVQVLLMLARTGEALEAVDA